MPNANKHEKRKHFRGKARPGRRVNVRYRHAADREAEFAQAVTGNIGVGGAFILTREPEPVGTELCILVQVPTDEQDIEVKGEVRWISSDTGEERAGMGIKFLDLDVEALLKLSEYFASLTGTEP